jgi:Carboxypeptidase regulatory-like domain/PDZ domain
MIAAALVALLATWLVWRDRNALPGAPPARAAAAAPTAAPAPARPAPARPAQPAPRAAPASRDDTSGEIDGRVLDGATHEGVPDAELTFVGEAGVSTFRTGSDGTFLATPGNGGSLALSAITAAGYLPYAPGVGRRGGQHVTLVRGQAVHGATFTLYPAVDYQGLVVDARSAPVAGARVRMLGASAGEPLPGQGAEWRTGGDGRFAFQAPEDAVLEASRGGARGWAHIDRDVAALKKLTIRLGHAPGDATITGHVRDRSGAAVGEALVRAAPSLQIRGVASAFAITGADGSFAIAGVDRASYDVSADADDHLTALRFNVLGGSRDVDLVLETGVMLSGQVVDAGGAPVPVYTLMAMRIAGAARPIVVERSLIDPQGRFAVRVPRGDYDVLAFAHGCARGTPTRATAREIENQSRSVQASPAFLAAASRSTGEVRIVLGAGATLRGRVLAADDHTPIAGASVACEVGRVRRDLPLPDPLAVTRADGTFELPDLAAGPLAIRIRANGYHDRVEGAMTVRDGAALAPIAIELSRIDPDDLGHTEMVGIGVDLTGDGDVLRVTRVLPGSGAFDAGLGFGDRIIAIEGVPVARLGVDVAIGQLRGAPGTMVTLTVRRDGRDLQVVIDRRLLRS